jgi:hypothetical protein
MARKKLGEMLIEAGMLDDATLRSALAEQRRWGGSLGRTLIEMKKMSEEDLVAVLSRQLGLQAVKIDTLSIPQSVLDLVPGELAQQWSLIPFAQPMKFLDVAMSDPQNLGIIDELRIRTQLNIRPYLSGPKAMERGLSKFYARGFGAFHRPDIAIAVETGDVVEVDHGGPHRATAATSAPQTQDGLRVYPRGAPSPTVAPPLGVPPPAANARDAEILALQNRMSQLEALVQRDEEVLRKLLALLIDKRVATRDEILERIR